MQSTKALGSLKSIFTQPLPLNKRSSKKLLDSITNSFRAQLDREHGWTPETPITASDAAHPISYLPSSTSSASSTTTYNHPTDRHLRAIVDNPIFSYIPPHYSLAKTPDQLATDPKLIFEAAVAKGIMTIPRAHGFLMKIQDNIQQSAAPSVRQAMKESGAGLLVLQWLRASGQERSLSFLVNRTFTKRLLSFMVVEGVDDLAWVWMERLMTLGDSGAAWLLHALVAAKYSNTVELDSAYKLMLQGVELSKERQVPLSTVELAWRELAWETTGHSWRHALPAQALYEAFLNILPPSPQLKMHHAHLQLYHPTNPSPQNAIAYLDDKANWYPQKDDASKSAKLKPPHSYAFSRFGQRLTSLTLDTVQHLTQKGEVKQAQDIFDHVRPYLTAFVKLDHAGAA